MESIYKKGIGRIIKVISMLIIHTKTKNLNGSFRESRMEMSWTRMAYLLVYKGPLQKAVYP